MTLMYDTPHYDRYKKTVEKSIKFGKKKVSNHRLADFQFDVHTYFVRHCHVRSDMHRHVRLCIIDRGEPGKVFHCGIFR